MRISAGMLLFALIDSGLAFFLVYYVAKAKFGGDKKYIARVMGAFLGTITFIIYFAVIVWFNTYPITAPEEVKLVVYWAPFVLSALMLILVHLSKPSKKESPEGVEEGDENEDEAENPEDENSAEDETPAP